MTEAEERELLKSKELFEDWFPGVVARLEAIPGHYLPCQRAPFVAKPDSSGKRAIRMALAYRTDQRDLRIDLRITLDVTPPSTRQMIGHSYHVGPNSRTDEYILRLCENPNHKHHFHLRGWDAVYQGGHIPASKADPPLSKEPLDFLDAVEHILKTNKSPIGVKK